MANLELELLSNVIKNGDMSVLRKRGVNAESFQTEEARRIFQWLWGEYNDPAQHGEVPDHARVLRHFADFDFCPSRNSITALTSEMLTNKVKSEAITLASDLAQFLEQEENDPHVLLSYYGQKLRELNASGTDEEGLSLSKAGALLRQEYDTNKQACGVTGIPYPWAPLNAATGGMQDEQFIVIYGRAKNAKCVVEGQCVLQRGGEQTPIEQLPDLCIIPSYTAATGKLRWAKAAKMDAGTKSCALVRTESGAQTRTSYDHPYMIPGGGFKVLRDLRVGDYVALAKVGHLEKSESMDSLVTQTGITWEQLVQRRDIGTCRCWDLSILDGQDENFVVEDFIVHNSWIALILSAWAYLNNRRVLVYSKEMSRETMLRRTASLVCSVDYELLRQGNLPPGEERHFFEAIDELASFEADGMTQGHRASMTFIGDRGQKKASSVDSITAIAEKFEPDLILVDGFYLMSDARSATRTADWKNITHISQDLKGMSQYLKVPVVGTTQANRSANKSEGDDLVELSFADAIGQDADVTMRTFLGKGPVPGKAAILLTFPGVRDGKLDPFLINFDPGRDYSLLQQSVNVAAFLKDKQVMEKEFEKRGRSEVGSEAEAKINKRKPQPKAKPFRA